MEQHCILSLLTVRLSISGHEVVRLTVLLLLDIALLQGLEASGDLVCGRCWRVVVVPATALPNIDNSWLTLHWHRVGGLGGHLLPNVSCGMPLHILSCLKLTILAWLLKSVLVDIHLRADDEHFGLVVSVAFDRGAAGLLLISAGLAAVTA